MDEEHENSTNLNPAESATDAAPATTTDDRPVIRVEAGALPRAVDAAEQAILGANIGIYEYGNALARLAYGVDGAAQKDGPKIHELGVSGLLDVLDQVARWEKFNGPARGWVPCNCPHEVADRLLGRRGFWKFPRLTAISQVPVIRTDGSVACRSGFDSATGLYIATAVSGLDLPTFKPERADAEKALRDLNAYLDGFQFHSPTDQSVAVAAMMTSVLRPSMENAPLFLISAHEAGTGKSTLTDILAVMATGQRAAVTSPATSVEEMNKRLTGLFLQGLSFIALDNCDVTLGGDLLCQLVTQNRVLHRKLGGSNIFEIASRAMIVANGNNLSVTRDLNRRSLLCHLTAGIERPELRAFARDPVADAIATREKAIAAVFTIALGYRASDERVDSTPLGSFGEWSRLVRDPLLWLGLADPCASQIAIRANDPDLDTLSAFTTAWHAAFGSAPKAAKEAISETNRAIQRQNADDSLVRLHDCLLEICGGERTANATKVGTWLRRQDGRVINGLRIEGLNVQNGVRRWRVIKVA